MENQHLYTVDTAERPKGWKFEGIAWFAFSAHSGMPQPSGTVPLYRWYNKHNNDHFYTSDPNGESARQNGYSPEGPTCYIFDPNQPQPAESVPLYRFFRQRDGVHFYTVDPQGENLSDYSPEGMRGFVYPKYIQGTDPVFRYLHPDGGGISVTDITDVLNTVNNAIAAGGAVAAVVLGAAAL